MGVRSYVEIKNHFSRLCATVIHSNNDSRIVGTSTKGTRNRNDYRWNTNSNAIWIFIYR